MSEIALTPKQSPSALHLFFEVSRFHIISIASLAALTFGWLLTDQHLWLGFLACALDWFVVNLTNRVVDLKEDEANGIVGTELVARRGRLFELGCFALMAVSVIALAPLAPLLVGPRVVFHAIGVVYNYKLIPTAKGRTRLKEVYFFKNFMSAVLFVLSTMLYPIAIAGVWPDPALFATLVFFFVPLEITYEIFYDLRDVAGDRELGVPTFPVVHGIATSHAIIVGLLVASAASLLVAFAAGAIPFKTVVLVAAVIQQALVFWYGIRRAPTARACIFATYLGAGQVLSYNLWIWAGLPTSF